MAQQTTLTIAFLLLLVPIKDTHSKIIGNTDGMHEYIQKFDLDTDIIDFALPVYEEKLFLCKGWAESNQVVAFTGQEFHYFYSVFSLKRKKSADTIINSIWSELSKHDDWSLVDKTLPYIQLIGSRTLSAKVFQNRYLSVWTTKQTNEVIVLQKKRDLIVEILVTKEKYDVSLKCSRSNIDTITSSMNRLVENS